MYCRQNCLLAFLAASRTSGRQQYQPTSGLHVHSLGGYEGRLHAKRLSFRDSTPWHVKRQSKIDFCGQLVKRTHYPNLGSVDMLRRPGAESWQYSIVRSLVQAYGQKFRLFSLVEVFGHPDSRDSLRRKESVCRKTRSHLWCCYSWPCRSRPFPAENSRLGLSFLLLRCRLLRSWKQFRLRTGN